METQKIVILVNGSDNENSKFATKQWYVLTVIQKVIIHKMTLKIFNQIYRIKPL